MEKYTAAQCRRNRRNIAIGAALTIALIALTSVIRGTGLAPAIGGIGAVLVISALLSWLFAASTSGPLPTDRKYARVWWVSNQWLERFGKTPK